MFINRVTPLQFLNLIALLVITALACFAIYQDHARQIQTAENNTRFIASLVARQTESTIAELDTLLHGVEVQLKLHDASPTQLPYQNIVTFLKETKAYNPQIMDLLVLDSRGIISGWTGSGTPPKVTDRAYTRYHLDKPDSKLYIGEPLLSKVHSGKWFFAISKAVRAPDQNLKNIVVAIVDIEKFQSLIGTMELPYFGSLALISKEGNIISRVPGHAQHVGRNIPLPYAVLKQQHSGNFDALSPFDNVERIAGYKHLDQFNITAFSTLSRDEVLSDWYELIYLILLLLLAIFSFFIWFNIKIHREKRIIESQRIQLSEQARTDELTGLFNRRYVMEKLHNEFRRAKQKCSHLSLLMIDIDHFKSINDQFGHDAGDAVLRKVAETMRTVSRKDSILGRIGGEEFLVLLPATTGAESNALAERIRQAVNDCTTSLNQHNIKCTVSIGVAECNFEDSRCTERATIKLADKALYKAKHSGRNRVVAYIDCPPVCG